MTTTKKFQLFIMLNRCLAYNQNPQIMMYLIVYCSKGDSQNHEGKHCHVRIVSKISNPISFQLIKTLKILENPIDKNLPTNPYHFQLKPHVYCQQIQIQILNIYD